MRGSFTSRITRSSSIDEDVLLNEGLKDGGQGRDGQGRLIRRNCRRKTTPASFFDNSPNLEEIIVKGQKKKGKRSRNQSLSEEEASEADSYDIHSDDATKPDLMADWRHELEIGSRIDARCPVSHEWLSAVVANADEDNIEIKYTEWSSRYNVWAVRWNKDVAPSGRRVVASPLKSKRKRRQSSRRRTKRRKITRYSRGESSPEDADDSEFSPVLTRRRRSKRSQYAVQEFDESESEVLPEPAKPTRAIRDRSRNVKKATLLLDSDEESEHEFVPEHVKLTKKSPRQRKKARKSKKAPEPAEELTPQEMAELNERKKETWRKELVVGSRIDAQCNVSFKWLSASVAAIEGDTLEIHYKGWRDRFNVLCDRWHEFIAPSDTKVIKRVVAPKPKKEPKAKPEDPSLLAVQSVKLVEMGHSKSGRPILVREDYHKAKTALSKKEIPEDDRLCGRCFEVEDSILSDIILCDGPCNRAFHLNCLGLLAPPEEDTWLCQDCMENMFECFHCGIAGLNNQQVFKCSLEKCSKFYHVECVWSWKNTRPLRLSPKDAQEEVPPSGQALTEFRCPRHCCDVCEEPMGSRHYLECLRCPISYHSNCVPPKTRFNVVGLLCRKHPDDPLPKIPSFYQDEEEEIVKGMTGAPGVFRFEDLPLPALEPKVSDVANLGHFRLPSEILEAVNSKPPVYQKIIRNIHHPHKPTRYPMDEYDKCQCRDKCSDDCINHLSFVECDGEPEATGGPRKWTTNCNVGRNCGNRALQERKYPKTTPVRYKGKGWGLRVDVDVKCGSIVHEYIGEIISEEMKNRRFDEHRQNFPYDNNMYIMDLGNSEYIDARFKSNLGRFINHSCEPNCQLQKWNVGGFNRIGIFAIRDINKNEELSYDYQFHTSRATDFICHCGSEKCRGTLARLPLLSDEDKPELKLTRKQQKKKEKLDRSKQLREAKKEALESQNRLSLTAAILPGDRRTPIAAGPSQVEVASRKGLFLSRNALRGFNLLSRKNEWRQSRQLLPKDVVQEPHVEPQDKENFKCVEPNQPITYKRVSIESLLSDVSMTTGIAYQEIRDRELVDQ